MSVCFAILMHVGLCLIASKTDFYLKAIVVDFECYLLKKLMSRLRQLSKCGIVLDRYMLF